MRILQALAIASLLVPFAAAEAPLRVCADPNNLPFSNSARAGFDNRIAELIARDLHTAVQYTWWSARRGYIRKVLYGNRCDVVIGIPEGMPRVLSTRPYYRSSYVFLYRRDRGLKLATLQDAALRRIRLGVQMVGEDYAPPAHVLAAEGIVDNLVPFSLLGPAGEPNPPSDIVKAVEAGKVDAAIVWGPFAGYFGRRLAKPLEIVPIPRSPLMPRMPFAYDICLGVRTGDESLQQALNGVLERRHAEIDRILAEYGVPRVATKGE